MSSGLDSQFISTLHISWNISVIIWRSFMWSLWSFMWSVWSFMWSMWSLCDLCGLLCGLCGLYVISVVFYVVLYVSIMKSAISNFLSVTENCSIDNCWQIISISVMRILLRLRKGMKSLWLQGDNGQGNPWNPGKVRK